MDIVFLTVCCMVSHGRQCMGLNLLIICGVEEEKMSLFFSAKFRCEGAFFFSQMSFQQLFIPFKANSVLFGCLL